MSSDLDRAFTLNGHDLNVTLRKTRIVVRSVNDHGGGVVSGIPVYPEALAEELLEEVAVRPHPLPAPPDWDGGLTGIPDREIDAIAAIKDALTGLDADTQRRIIRYWAARTLADDPF